MKKTIYQKLLFIFFFTLTISVASAQTPDTSTSLGLRAFLVSPDEDTESNDVGLALDLAIPLSDTFFITGEFDAYGWDKEDNISDILINAENDFYAFLIGVKVFLNVNLPLTPYIAASIGYQINQSDIDIKNFKLDDDIDNSLIYRGEAGVEARLFDALSIFGSVTYQLGDATIDQTIKTDSTTLVIKKDEDLNAFFANVGVRIYF